MEYSPQRPKLFEVKYRDEEEDYPYNQITIEEENEFFPSFQMPPIPIWYQTTRLCVNYQLAYPNEFLKTVCKRSNTYAITGTKFPSRIPVDKDKLDGETKPNRNFLRQDKVKPIFPATLLCYHPLHGLLSTSKQTQLLDAIGPILICA